MKRLLARLLRQHVQIAGADPQQHCVLVSFKLRSPGFGDHAERDAIHRFTAELAAAIAGSAVGEFDGDEFGEGECTLFMYGPDADRLFAVVQPLLISWKPLKGGSAIKRYGPPGSSEQRVNF